MDQEKVCITVRLNDDENEKLRQAAAAEICTEIEQLIVGLQEKFTAGFHGMN